MKAFNIRWAVSDPYILETLPKVIDIPKKVIKKDSEGMIDVNSISNYVCSVTGYSHLGFAIDYETDKKKRRNK